METFYIKLLDDRIFTLVDRLPIIIRYQAKTIWRETSSGVCYVKHRNGSVTDPVDMDEFIWIKLRSNPL